MTVATGRRSRTVTRRRYRREVEELLERIRVGVDELERMVARGVRDGGLGEQRRDLAQARARLAALVADEPGDRAA